MEKDLPASDAQQDNTLNPNLILTDWLLAVNRLTWYYQQLTNLLANETAHQANACEPDRYIGQCPLGRLLSLQVAIQGELAGLLQEMNHLSQLKSTTLAVKYKRMVSHTLILNQLNHRAHLKLLLAGLPALATKLK